MFGDALKEFLVFRRALLSDRMTESWASYLNTWWELYSTDHDSSSENVERSKHYSLR